jgi:hypothetical protein
MVGFARPAEFMEQLHQLKLEKKSIFIMLTGKDAEGWLEYQS